MSGNVWMFSDEIDDEDLEFMSHDYVTYNMACEYYKLGIKPVVRMAHEADRAGTLKYFFRTFRRYSCHWRNRKNCCQCP